MHNLPVARVDLTVVEGPDSHDDADVVVALPVRVDGVRRHPAGIWGEGEKDGRNGSAIRCHNSIHICIRSVEPSVTGGQVVVAWSIPHESIP